MLRDLLVFTPDGERDMFVFIKDSFRLPASALKDLKKVICQGH